MSSLSPVLEVDDIKETIEFYIDLLDFSVVAYMPDEENPELAIMRNGNVELIFQLRESIEKEYPIMENRQKGGSFSLYIDVDDIEQLYQDCVEKGIPITRDLQITESNNEEFGILDNNGYILEFAIRDPKYRHLNSSLDYRSRFTIKKRKR